MFIGHYGPAFVAATRPRAPRLGWLFVAAQLIDFGFFAFVALGLEHLRLVPGTTAMNPMDLYSMPYTHSLLGTLVWAAAFAGVLWFAYRNREAALIGAIIVVSHWVIDLLVHAPDLTLWGSAPKFGLGLWNHPLIEMPLELFFAYGGFAWYLRRTRLTSRAGRWAPWVLGIAMAALQAFNWFGPQPDTIVDPVPVSQAFLGLFAYTLLAVIAWWLASTRTARG
ncbi:hypothetical protein ACLB0R_01660 [Sphingomonas sp. GlSt437]|uniref:hypothetical protein n=1 Tax=Sphingomonas sp. GlSt437 TaxID=3389970 RepID=UPI003A846C8B